MLPIEIPDEEPKNKEPAAETDQVECWEPMRLLEHAEMMTRLKDRIYENGRSTSMKPKSWSCPKESGPWSYIYMNTGTLVPTFSVNMGIPL